MHEIGFLLTEMQSFVRDRDRYLHINACSIEKNKNLKRNIF